MRRVILLVVAGVATAGCGQLSQPPARSVAATTTVPAFPRSPRQYGGAANFVRNPSFERRVAPWVPLDQASALEVTSAVRRIGKSSARVVATAATSYGIQNVGVLANPERGERFQLSAWVRSGDRPKTVTIRIQALGPADTLAAETIAMARRRIGSDWTRIRVEGVERRRDRTLVVIGVVVDRSIAIGDTFFVDGVVLENPQP